jgi:hypothetical protein
VPLDFQQVAHFLGTFSESFLQSADEFIILALSIFEIVVGQFGILLFKLAFDFIPRTFELQFVHTDSSPLPCLAVWTRTPVTR